MSNDNSIQTSARVGLWLPPYVVGASISAAWFCLALVLALSPGGFDLPATRFINKFASISGTLDMCFYDLDHYNIFSGTLIMALIWFVWFGAKSLEERGSILAGTLIAFPLGMVSRFLQHGLPTHPRPFYDPSLGFHHPSMLPAEPLNTWNSFPSDHATAFGALVVVIVIHRPKLGWFVIPWFVLLELARVYVGAHYPSDVIGGAALAATAIFAAQAPWVTHLGQRLAVWERSSPPQFYMLAFFTSYQIATLFADLRYMAGGINLFHLIRL